MQQHLQAAEEKSKYYFDSLTSSRLLNSWGALKLGFDLDSLFVNNAVVNAALNILACSRTTTTVAYRYAL